jgi:putative transposase
MGKKHQPEEIIGKLREAEVVLAQGGTVAGACRRIGHGAELLPLA